MMTIQSSSTTVTNGETEMSITPGETYKVEDEDINVFGKSWQIMEGNPAAMLYAVRSAMAFLPWDGKVYYGKIGNSGELVHESELEPVE